MITHTWHDAYLQRFGGDLALCWGMTETGAASTGGHPGERPIRPGFVGRGMHDVELAIVDGEIRLRYRHRMLEYLDDAVATAETVTPDGWVRSGDVGELDDEGRLFYGGRIKNMIKRSGENISPEELENALVEHGEVSEVLVIGVPDPIRTEEVAVIVVAAPGSDPRPEQLVGSWLTGWAGQASALRLGAGRRAAPLGKRQDRSPHGRRRARRGRLLGPPGPAVEPLSGCSDGLRRRDRFAAGAARPRARPGFVDAIEHPERRQRARRARYLFAQLEDTWPLAFAIAAADAAEPVPGDTPERPWRLARITDRRLALFPRARPMAQLSLAGLD